MGSLFNKMVPKAIDVKNLVTWTSIKIKTSHQTPTARTNLSSLTAQLLLVFSMMGTEFRLPVLRETTSNKLCPLKTVKRPGVWQRPQNRALEGTEVQLTEDTQKGCHPEEAQPRILWIKATSQWVWQAVTG